MAASLSDSSMASEVEGPPTQSETPQAAQQRIIRLAVSNPSAATVLIRYLVDMVTPPKFKC